MDETSNDKACVDSKLVLGAMDALTQHFAVVDGRGKILIVNEAWKRFDQEHFSHLPDYLATSIYDAWLLYHRMTPDDAAKSRFGLESVLSGHLPHFTLEYADYSTTQTRWFTLTFTALPHTYRGVVISRLEVQARESDLLARFGGDEFVVLLNGVTALESLISVQRFQESLAQPFTVRGQLLSVGASFGIAWYPSDGTTLETLLSQADGAMYRTKTKRRGSPLDRARKLQAEPQPEVQPGLTFQDKGSEQLSTLTS